MIINLATPVVRPPVEAKTFPDVWISNLDINIQPGSAGRAIVTWLPWRSADNTFPEDMAPRQFNVPDLLGKLESDAGFQNVWEAITSYLAAYMADAGIASPS